MLSASNASNASSKRHVHVINRHGDRVPVLFDRITDRLASLTGCLSKEAPETDELDASIDPAEITKEIAKGIADDMTTAEIDNLAAQAAHFASTRHPHYGLLASRVLASNGQKRLNLSFSEHADELCTKQLVRPDKNAYIQKHKAKLDPAIKLHRDARFSYFGWKTLRRAYLHKVPTGKKNKIGQPTSRVHDTPQYMWMRTAVEVSDVVKGPRPAILAASAHASEEERKRQQQKQQEQKHEGSTAALQTPFEEAKTEKPPAPQTSQTPQAFTSEQLSSYGPEFERLSKLVAEAMTVIEKSPEMLVTLGPIIGRLMEGMKNLVANGGKESRAPSPAPVWDEPEPESVIANYHALSQMWFIHASPTLFHSLMKRNGLSSCFLLPPIADALTEGSLSIYQFLAKCAAISAVAGGIGFNASNVRCTGQPIRGSNGTSNGLIPMLRVFNASARYVDQGGQKRPGAIAVYLEPWHGDIIEFLAMKTPEGEENSKCKDLHYGMWIPDLFMRRVRNHQMWSLMSPDVCPGLVESYGAEFEALYEKYEAEGKFIRQIPAEDLMIIIAEAQPATGSPYMMSKDACNAKSNQKNLGTIKSSNLCVAPETLIWTKEAGYVPIGPLAGKKVEVWNGERFSPVNVRETSAVPQSVVKVSLSNGMTVDVTPYHMFPIVVGVSGGEVKQEKQAKQEKFADQADPDTYHMVPASDLKTGMQLLICNTLPEPLVQPKPEEDADALDRIAIQGRLAGKAAMWQAIGGDDVLLRDISGRDTGVVLSSQPYVCRTPGSTSSKRAATVWWTNVCGTHGALKKATVVGEEERQLDLVVPCLIESTAQEWLLFLQQQYHIDATIRLGRLDALHPCQVYLLHIGMEGIRTLVREGFDVETLDDNHVLDETPAFQSLKSPRLSSLGGAVVSTDQASGQASGQDSSVTFSQNTRRRAVQIVSVKDCGRLTSTYCFDEPQRHLGMFNGVLLGNCTEILEYTSIDEIAVCNLASISLPALMRKDGDFPIESCEDETRDGAFAPPALTPDQRAMLFRRSARVPTAEVDLMLLYRVTCRLVRNLNRVIDVGYYPVAEAETSNMRHRPIGIGVQGLADLFVKLRWAFTSPEAMELNEAISATIYYAAVRTSMLMAKRDGRYSTFDYNGGCPMAHGQFQFDMWDKDGPTKKLPWDWETLRQDVMKHGLRNSLLVAPMPTAGTSQILDNNEAFYPILHNYYTRDTAAGKFPVFQKQLIEDLINAGKWSVAMKQQIISGGGSIQDIPNLEPWMYEVYRTWDEQPRDLLLQNCYDRARYCCQGQSLNIRRPVSPDTIEKLVNYFFKCWELGMKNWSYYFKSSPAREAARTSLDAATFAASFRAAATGAVGPDAAAKSATATALPPGLAQVTPGRFESLPVSVHLTKSKATTADLFAAIDAVDGGVNETDELRRLMSNIQLARKSAEEDDDGAPSAGQSKKQDGAAECTIACGS